MTSFDGEEAVKAYAQLMHAIQTHDGKVSGKLFDPGLYQTRSAGKIYADAALFSQIIKLTAEFGEPAAIVSFLIYIRPVLIKWLDLRKSRSIEVRCGDVSVQIQGDNDVDKALDAFKKLSATIETHTDSEGSGAA